MTPSFKFSTPVKVRFVETDQQGHVYFGNYYTYFDVALEAYLDAIGYDYPQILEDEVDFVYAESHCAYKSPAKWPELLNIHARIGPMGNRSLRFEFEIRADADDRLVAAGHIVAVTVDQQTFEPRPIPDKLRQAVAAYETADS